MADLRVVLVSPRNPLNIGAAARAMSNFGFTQLRLVNPYAVAFREAKSAVGAEAVLREAVEYSSIAEAVADCSLVVGTTAGDRRNLDQPLYRLETGTRRLRRHQGPAALLFGSEKHGLSNEDMSHCHWLMQIPCRAGHKSMNLGQAVAVCLYECIRDLRGGSAQVGKKAATAAQTEQLRLRLEEALRISGYYKHTAVAGAERRLRNLILRLQLSQRDATVLLGMMRQIVWKLKADAQSRQGCN